MDFLPNTPSDREEMLKKVGFSSMQELIDSAIPNKLQLKGELNLPSPLSEYEAVKHASKLAASNKTTQNLISFLGAGSYDHFIPAAVSTITSRSEFYTAYTPYQAEVSQGTLQAIFEFQSIICHLTNMAVANASMYDGGSAIAEGAIFAMNQTRRKKVLYSSSINPLCLEVIKTYLNPAEGELVPVELEAGSVSVADFEAKMGDDVAAFILQNPSFFGVIEDGYLFSEKVHEAGAIYIVATDPTSLGILNPPGDYGADIVVGEGQALGNPLSFGGPYLGFYAATEKFTRKMPGRLSGMTADVDGSRGFVLTLQTREQHIRREKATSNICTNEALCALAATVYVSLLGETGFNQMSKQCFDKAHYLANKLTGIEGIKLAFDKPFFKEFTMLLPESVNMEKVYSELLRNGFVAGFPLEKYYPNMKNSLLIAVTEKRTKEEMDGFTHQISQYV